MGVSSITSIITSKTKQTKKEKEGKKRPAKAVVAVLLHDTVGSCEFPSDFVYKNRTTFTKTYIVHDEKLLCELCKGGTIRLFLFCIEPSILSNILQLLVIFFKNKKLVKLQRDYLCMLLFDELICVEYGKSVFMRFMHARSSYTTARAGLHRGRKKRVSVSF